MYLYSGILLAIDWVFWGRTGVLGAIVFWLGFVNNVFSFRTTLFKWFKPKPPTKLKLPKPIVLSISNCSISIGNFFLKDMVGSPLFCEQVWFDLVINNQGERDCAVKSIDLRLPNGRLAEELNSKPSLPKVISVDHSEKFTTHGYCTKPQVAREAKKELTAGISTEQASMLTTIIIKFNNTEDIIVEKVPFNVKHLNRRI